MIDRAPRRRWRLAGLLLAVAVSGYLLVVLARRFELDHFVAVARGVSPWSLAAALLLYLLLGGWRALRFRVLLEQPELPLRGLLPVALLHNLLVRTLPAGIGEISFVTLSRRHLGVEVGRGIGTLLGARLFELLLIIVGGVTCAVAAGPWLDGRRDLVLAVGVAALVVCLVGLSVSGPVARRIAGVVGRLRRWPAAQLVSAKLTGMAGSLDALRRPRVFAGAAALSVCTYSTSLSISLVLLRAAGVKCGLPALVAIHSLVSLASAIPLSISGLGIAEGSWTFGLVTLAGVEVGRAVSVAFFLHGWQLLSAILTGLAGYAWLLRRPARVEAAR